jgi:4-amino-4-deoxy-L-arabinose transferase-like glycosyltransferase
MSAQNSLDQSPNTPRPLEGLGWSIGVFLIALAFRLTIQILTLPSLLADRDAYRRLAQTLYATGTFGVLDPQGHPVATAYRPPLYPWLLSWLQGFESDLLPIAILHAILGAFSVTLTFRIALRLGLNGLQSLAASALVLFDPILLRQSTLVMTETLATFLGLFAWWLALFLDRNSTRGIAIGAVIGAVIGLAIGATLGIACLCRPTALAWALLWGGSELRRNPLRASCILLGCLLVLLPWWKRNQSEIGQGLWATTHGGYTLLLANNPILYEHWETSWSRQWDDDRFHAWWHAKRFEENVRGESDELASDALANALGWQSIRANPVLFFKACAIREGWMWAWWPAEHQAHWILRVAIGIWYAITTIAAFVGLIRLLGRAGSEPKFVCWLPALTLAASLCLVHAVYWSNMRMRAPIIPVISLLAVYGSRGLSVSVPNSPQRRQVRQV